MAQDNQLSLSALRGARQLIALVDQPRPQVSLYTWSLQLSGKKSSELQKPPRNKTYNAPQQLSGKQPNGTPSSSQDMMDLATQEIYSISTVFNDRVTRSIGAGWRFLREQINASSPGFFDPVFTSYLRGQVAVERAPTHSVEDVRLHVKCCGSIAAPDTTSSLAYGLGFERLFSQFSPNLMDMLLVVSASSNPAGTADCLIDRLELEKPTPTDHGSPGKSSNCFSALPDEPPSARWSAGCQAADDAEYGKGSRGFEMECTRKLLHELFSAETADEPNPQLGRFRATVADFLFQDKMMAEYPNEFDAYLEPASASKLDAQLVEFVDAFESDLAVLNYFVRDRVAAALNTRADKGQFYDYSGIVSVKVVAGNQALVQTQAQNYFPATPPVTLKDVVSALSAAGAAAANPSVLPGNIPAEAVTSALAGLAQIVQAKQTVSIGRELDMTVTPYSLSAGDGAEMDIDVTSKDNGASVVGASPTGTSTAVDDLSSRVANDHVKTHVRLESLKLFELSALDSTLARGKTPWKLVDPYLEIPIIGELVRVPRRPDIIQQRSIVFLSAVVVPTAADLAATPIEEDLDGPNFDRPGRNLHSLSAVSPQLLDRLKEYHRRMLDCLSAMVTDDKGGTSGCTPATMARHAQLLGLSR